MVAAMASARLANSHHPLHHQHLLHHPHLHHLPIVRSSGPAAGQMTLDYSLPNRSRVNDSDQSELPSLITVDTEPNGSQSDDAFSNTADAISPQRSSSPTGSENRDRQSPFETPTKRNKRKLSEPKRRTDFKVKRLSSEVEATEEKVPEDKVPCVVDALHSVTSVQADICRRPSSASSSMSSTYSWHKKKCPSPEDRSVLSTSTSPTSSTAPFTNTKSSAEEQDNKDASTTDPSATNIPPHFLHPFLTGVPPAAFSFVPGLYFGGQSFSRPPLTSAFPAAVPLHIQQNYIAAAAAAAAAAQSAAAVSASAQNQSLSSKSEIPESSPFAVHQTSSSSQSHATAQPGQTQVPSYQSMIHPASSSQCKDTVQTSFPSSSSSLLSNLPTSTRSALDNQIDDDDDSSSQVHSPEDLTMGGKMSRKHRKNYKNMTRERRVEANARERTRVHTISAAFEALRRAVPSYSYNQKLSKLAILRIACSYIMSLARLADLDYTSPSEHIQKPLTFAECVDMCTNTIQTEGRARRRH